MPSLSPRAAPACFAALVLGTLTLLTGSGCAHYQAGPGGTSDIHRLYIAPIDQTPGLPQAGALITTAVREAFMRDGRVRLADSPAHADAVLTLQLGPYRRETATVQPADTGLARKFDLTLAVAATLASPRGDRVWFADRPFQVRRQIFVDQGQLQAEYQAVPHLAAQIADRALHAVLDVW
jgi:hypothetical protein